MAMPKAQMAPAAPVTVDDLLARGAILIRKIEDCQRQAVDDPKQFDEAGKLVVELNSIPVMVGEIRRREVLNHIAVMAQEAQRLSKELAAAQAELDAFEAESVALSKQLRRTPRGPEKTRLQGELDKRGRQNDKLRGKVMTLTAQLDARYGLAVRSYGCFLDQSARQLQHRAGLHPTLSYAGASSEQAWEQAAQRIAAREREQAQRNLLANVLKPLVWAWR